MAPTPALAAWRGALGFIISREAVMVGEIGESTLIVCRNSVHEMEVLRSLGISERVVVRTVTARTALREIRGRVFKTVIVSSGVDLEKRESCGSTLRALLRDRHLAFGDNAAWIEL